MFIGVSTDSLNSFIQKNNFYVDSIVENEKSLINAINELDQCYSGKTLDFVFFKIMKEQKNIEKLTRTVQSYSDFLYCIDKAYRKQNENVAIQISYNKSNL